MPIAQIAELFLNIASFLKIKQNTQTSCKDRQLKQY